MSSVPEWWKPYAKKHPGWTVYIGTDQLYHASLTAAKPPVIVRGESPDDLNDMILREKSR
jgi:hypothetical protein